MQAVVKIHLMSLESIFRLQSFVKTNFCLFIQAPALVKPKLFLNLHNIVKPHLAVAFYALGLT